MRIRPISVVFSSHEPNFSRNKSPRHQNTAAELRHPRSGKGEGEEKEGGKDASREREAPTGGRDRGERISMTMSGDRDRERMTGSWGESRGERGGERGGESLKLSLNDIPLAKVGSQEFSPLLASFYLLIHCVVEVRYFFRN
jgi:hypothetical protein